MSRTGKDRLRGLALEEEVVKLRLAGLSFPTIARNLSCSVSGAHKACMRAIARRLEKIGETTEQVLQLELERLDVMLRVLWPKCLAGEAGAIDRALRIMERRARYLGLDKPERHEHTGAEGGPIRHEYDFSHLSDEELEREIAATLAEAESVARGAAAQGEEA